MAVAALAARGWADLPAESVVPGERHDAAPLPPESALPPYAIALRAAAPPATLPAASDAAPPADMSSAEPAAPEASPSPPPPLPSEQTVPRGAAAPDAGAPNDLPVKGSPDGIPWLRLNLRGHTAPIRALTFSEGGDRIFTAGEDKTLVAWAARHATPGGPASWAYERTVRWQIQRGARGRIYALAASPRALALAGDGAMGASGEILLLDPQTGELAATLQDLAQGHRQVVVALSFAPGRSDVLASLSMDGALVHWQLSPQGLWRPARLSPPDGETANGNSPLARRLLAGRTSQAIAALNATQIVAPAFWRLENDRVVWRLELYDRTTGDHRPLGDPQQAPHWDSVKALAVSRDGQRLASADGGGYVYLWDLRTSPATVRVLARAQAWSLGFDASGSRLVIGGDDGANGQSSVDVWNVESFSSPQRVAQFASDDDVMACGLSADGQTVAWTSRARAFVRPVSGGVQQELPAGVTPPLRVAFPAEQPYYFLGIARAAVPGEQATFDREFDTDLVRLNRVNQPEPGKWLPETWLANGWSVGEEGAIAGQRSIWLYQGGARRSRAPLTEERHGRLTAWRWIPSRVAGAAPLAAALGTSGGGIYLVTPTAQGEAPIVRQLRGHSAAITSLAVSRDLRYLASSSLDGMVCVWPLDEIADAEPAVQRWGASFAVENGALVAARVRPNGPTYFRGLRDGDAVAELRYVDAAGAVRTVAEPEQMRAALAQLPWETLLTFRVVRGRDITSEFQILPAWQQLATLFVADDGEWAYWHPAGFYDASFEGHKLFGWQINRGLEMLPDFFLAAQFRRQLERPGVMAQLLRRGTLEAAFRAAQSAPPIGAEDAIVNSYRLKPDVEILAPRDGDDVNGTVKLVARLSVDAAERLTPPKAFANGVVAVSRRLVGEDVADGRRRSTYEWELKLPSDPQVMLQVAAATEHEVTAGASVVVANRAPRPASPPRLHLIAVGVDNYRDAQIPRLTTAVKTTDDVLAVLEARTPSLYRMDAASLVDDRATKASWRFLTAQYAERLARDATPDDLVVVLLSGHGVQAPGDDGYQFVTADARYADVMAGRYGDCLSVADLAFLADVPCRKLVILNTCHGGGAASPLVHRELKSAVRALQGDMMLTLAASAGTEEAVEGRFAQHLLDALGGAADADADGVVSLSETVAYVSRAVTAESRGDAVRQSPAAGPKELLSYAFVPLTASGKTRISAASAVGRSMAR
jgi:WD40 repeat protein